MSESHLKGDRSSVGDDSRSRERALSKGEEASKSNNSRNQFNTINSGKLSSLGGVKNTLESEEESDIEIAEDPSEAMPPIQKLPLFEQMK